MTSSTLFILIGLEGRQWNGEEGEKENEAICGYIDWQVRAIDQKEERDGEMGGGGDGKVSREGGWCSALSGQERTMGGVNTINSQEAHGIQYGRVQI